MRVIPDSCDIVVIGAGPAGLMAAIAAAQKGFRVLVCERMVNVGRKLLASGGGRGNLTNALGTGPFSRAFGKLQAPLVASCLKQFSGNDIRHFFESRGVPLALADGFHFFPASDKAADLLDALIATCKNLPVVIATDVCVEEIISENEIVTGIRYVKGEDIVGTVATQACVLASGGMGYPKLGGFEGGYALARACGHTVVTPLMALVGLTTQETWPAQCAGTSVEWARISLSLPKEPGLPQCTEGGLIFTHEGISGPAALNISGIVARLLQTIHPVPLRCIVQKETNGEKWFIQFEKWQQQSGKVMLATRLAEILPQRLVQVLLKLAPAPPELLCAEVTRAVKVRIVDLLTRGIELNVTGTSGWQNAMVTSGGISLDEVDFKTLESKKLKGLYCAGEVLDCDGPCGGYNLTFAMSSGWVAGRAATQSVEIVETIMV